MAAVIQLLFYYYG